MAAWRKTVAVFGSSGITRDSPRAAFAHRCGKALAERGCRVVTGGYMGVMEAASRGAREAGGAVLGVTTDAFGDRTPNPYLDEEIRTRDLPERITRLMREAEAFIVLDGGVGTLAELMLALNLVYMGDERRVIVVGENLRLALEGLERYTELKEAVRKTAFYVDTPEEAAALAAES